MLQLIKMEISKLKYPYLIILFIALLFSGGIVISRQYGFSYNYNIEVWEQSGELFGLFFPFFAVVTACWLMFCDRKKGNNSSNNDRESKEKYMLSKWLVSSISGAFITFFISFIGLIISLYFIPDVKPFGSDYAIGYFAGNYFVNHPFLYGLVLSCWRAFIGFVVASFGFVLWIYLKNIFVMFTGPFIYMILENIILAYLNVPYFRLITSFDPSTLDSDAITIGRLLVGPLILILLISGLLCFRIIVKRLSRKQRDSLI
ncbi:hypothetical protein [Bacillus sp. B1-b2]|uniref:hypothetical protein n=1 Tax=Bacillus sp. B1-b2 TaxID=2653201 RepID=UPI0012620C6F|nr:hypothetical protein [Bacillus sp. B1-b2]KAB7672131.1 hypothetical protein F9279_04250 [Bacillus sp. B1-b2]